MNTFDNRIPRNRTRGTLYNTCIDEAFGLFRALLFDRARVAARVEEDAAPWAFVIRDGRESHEGLGVTTGAELAANYAWARQAGTTYDPHLWLLVGHRLCPVRIDWDCPTRDGSGSLTSVGTVNFGGTRLGSLAYVIEGAIT